MNILLLQSDNLPTPDGGRLTLSGSQARHITQIIRPAEGDQLRVGVLNGLLGMAKVLRIYGPGELELEVTLDTDPPKPLPLTLLLALPRPKVLRRVLQSATTLGVKQIYLLNSYRVDKSYWQTPLLAEEAVHEQLLLGLEQARDTLLPQVHLRQRFKPFVEDELPELVKGKTCFTAHPAPDALPCPSSVKEDSVLAVGPEGGFIQYEVNKLNEAGFETIGLGPRILKVETAIPALVSKLFL